MLGRFSLQAKMYIVRVWHILVSSFKPIGVCAVLRTHIKNRLHVCSRSSGDEELS